MITSFCVDKVHINANEIKNLDYFILRRHSQRKMKFKKNQNVINYYIITKRAATER